MIWCPFTAPSPFEGYSVKFTQSMDHLIYHLKWKASYVWWRGRSGSCERGSLGACAQETGCAVRASKLEIKRVISRYTASSRQALFNNVCFLYRLQSVCKATRLSQLMWYTVTNGQKCYWNHIMLCGLSEYCQFRSQTEQRELLQIAYLRAGLQLSRSGPEQHPAAFIECWAPPWHFL